MDFVQRSAESLGNRFLLIKEQTKLFQVFLCHWMFKPDPSNFISWHHLPLIACQWALHTRHGLPTAMPLYLPEGNWTLANSPVDSYKGALRWTVDSFQYIALLYRRFFPTEPTHDISPRVLTCTGSIPARAARFCYQVRARMPLPFTHQAGWGHPGWRVQWYSQSTQTWFLLPQAQPVRFLKLREQQQVPRPCVAAIVTKSRFHHPKDVSYA